MYVLLDGIILAFTWTDWVKCKKNLNMSSVIHKNVRLGSADLTV
jgi:hypothetical protein